MTPQERRGGDQEPFWHLDAELGDLELRERPGGRDVYTVRLKARTGVGLYHAKRKLYPLEHDGTEHEISGKAHLYLSLPKNNPAAEVS